MKNIIITLLFVLTSIMSYGQCSSLAVQISSSDTAYVQLYHAGFFLIPSGFANVCEWEATSFSGDILHQATTSGAANDQGFTLFDHSIPISDSIKVTIKITNEMEGITCTMSDTLYWKETEILPGSFIGNWDVLSSNGGVEEIITSSTDRFRTVPEIELFPSPAYDHFEIRSDLKDYSIAIFDLNGQILATYQNIHKEEKIDISPFPSGMYFVQFRDGKSRNIAVEKIIKI